MPFTLTLHRLKQKEDSEQFSEEEDEDELLLPQYADDLMNINNDFPSRAHCLARWFIILTLKINITVYS